MSKPKDKSELHFYWYGGVTIKNKRQHKRLLAKYRRRKERKRLKYEY